MNNLSNQNDLTPELIREYNEEKAKASFQIGAFNSLSLVVAQQRQCDSSRVPPKIYQFENYYKIDDEILRRRNIGQNSFEYLKKDIFISAKSTSESEKSINGIIALIREAEHLVGQGTADISDDKLVRVRYAQLADLISKSVSKLPPTLSKTKITPFYLANGSRNNEPFEKSELFNSDGVLLRPDIIETDESTGLYKPKSSCSIIDADGYSAPSGNYVISPSSGLVYPFENSILFDPGRLRLLVFDEATAKVCF